jgi:tetratricopeptide (TPR) repeat protein
MRMAARAAAILVAAIVCGWLLVRWAYAPLACNIALSRLTQRTDLAMKTTADYVRLTRLRQNLEDLRRLEGRCALDVRLYMLKAANDEVLGRDEDAVYAYRQALQIDRRPEIYSSLGFAFIRLGRFEEAAQNYAVAARFTNEITNIPSEEVERRVVEILRGGK